MHNLILFFLQSTPVLETLAVNGIFSTLNHLNDIYISVQIALKDRNKH